MEMFGIGPEMFQNRAISWEKAFAEVLKQAIADLGIIAAAVLLLVQNVRSSQTVKDLKEEIRGTKEEVNQRFSDQGKKINDVAIATNATLEVPADTTVRAEIINPPSHPVPVAQAPKPATPPPAAVKPAPPIQPISPVFNQPPPAKKP